MADSRADEPPGRRLHAVPGGGGQEVQDVRVSAVLEVLAGQATGEVAQRWSVEPALLHRWVRAFVDAGTAEVTNRPSEDSARQRDRFLAAFAHELRTPLAVAQGWGEMLLDDLPAAMVTTTVQRLNDALERLAERTLDVELLAAASLGRLRLEPRPTPVSAVVDGIVGAGATEDGDQELVVDPDLFRRVVRDLWQAASLPPAPLDLRLDVVARPPWAELRVVRVGDPIPHPVLQALFDPFDLNDDATGITIGLYLARALVVAHGGTLGLEQDDRGAVFHVRVPLVHPTTQERPVGDSQEE